MKYSSLWHLVLLLLLLATRARTRTLSLGLSLSRSVVDIYPYRPICHQSHSSTWFMTLDENVKSNQTISSTWIAAFYVYLLLYARLDFFSLWFDCLLCVYCCISRASLFFHLNTKDQWLKGLAFLFLFFCRVQKHFLTHARFCACTSDSPIASERNRRPLTSNNSKGE